MTDMNDFEDALREGMQVSTDSLVAHDDLQRRLVAAAAAGPVGPPLTHGYFRSSWALPAAAAVVTAVTIGSIVAATRAGPTASVLSGTGTTVPRPTSSAPPAPAPTPTPARTPTPKISTTTAHTSAPARPSHSAPTTGVPRSSPATRVTSRPSNSARPKPPPAISASCSAPAHGTSNPTTLAEFKRRITGTWRVCANPSVFGTSDAGLRIAADGHWAKLVRDKAGRLVPGSGLYDSGTWKALDESDMNDRPAYQLNLMSGNGTYILLADFAAAVNRVRLDNNGRYQVDYVPTAEAVVGA